MKAFLSHTRIKNRFNFVSQFRDHLENELQWIERDASVFQDDEIGAGENFPERLVAELRDTDVLVLFLSPAWLQSDWCRKEFEYFTDSRQDIARLGRVLPLLMVDTPALSMQSSDPIAAKLAAINSINWRGLRHESWENPEKLRQIAKLSERIVVLATAAV